MAKWVIATAAVTVERHFITVMSHEEGCTRLLGGKNQMKYDEVI